MARHLNTYVRTLAEIIRELAIDTTKLWPAIHTYTPPWSQARMALGSSAINCERVPGYPCLSKATATDK